MARSSPTHASRRDAVMTAKPDDARALDAGVAVGDADRGGASARVKDAQLLVARRLLEKASQRQVSSQLRRAGRQQ